MADLSTLDASSSTKIAGADATGQETGFVASTSNQELKVKDTTYETGVIKGYTVTATTTPQSVPASAVGIIRDLTIETSSGLFIGNAQISFDGGSTYFTISAGDTLRVDPVRGAVTAILLKTDATTNSCKLLIGFES